MKILRIIARLNVGGPARHVVWLTQHLQDDEFQSAVIAGRVPPGEGDMAYFAEQNGVTPTYIDDLSRELSLRDVFALRKIYSEIKSYQPDIVHTHTAKAGTLGRIAAFAYRWITFRTLLGKPRRIRVVHTFHGHVFHSYYGPLMSKVYVAIERSLARLATDTIVVISSQQFREINEQFKIGKPTQYRVIPLGIDLEQMPNRKEIHPPADEIIVGLVGRLTEVKNVPLLLEAAALHLADHSAAVKMKFVIIGDGHLRDQLEAHARTLGVESIVNFQGSKQDIESLIAEFDIMALTSLNEGTPLSLIEAMACGVPVVATDVGGVSDLIGEKTEFRDNFYVCHRGIAVESRSARSLYDGLRFLAGDKELRDTLANRGIDFVRREYSLARLVRDMKGLYHELSVG